MLIINADDLGMTPGTNKAIFDGFDKGAITHASIMANCDYFMDAMQDIPSRPNLGIGMHLNLTYGKALIANPLYCDKNGFFNLGYKDLLLTKNKEFLKAIEKEWEAQIQRVLEYSSIPITLTHLDSHRHIHLIPHLYPIVVKLAFQYNIRRIRLINENILSSFSLTKRFNFIFNGGIIKFLLLRTFSLIDSRYKNFYSNIKFYSILYTGVIRGDILQKLQNSSSTYEIMVHPNYPELDSNITFYDDAEKAYRISSDREDELKSVLSIEKEILHV